MESQHEYTKLFEKINSQIKINKARLDCLTYLIISMLRNQTVNYNKLAQGFPKELDLSSHLRRIQRFFAEVTFDEKDFSKLLSKMIPVKGKYKLSMDRTNWKFGSLNINLLYLSVIYDGVGIPILWSVLGDKRGNSNTKERKDLMERFIQLFGVEKIEYLTADREFVGYHWWNFLLEKKIQFNIRFRQNFYVVLKNGKTTQAKNLLCQKGLQSLYCHRNLVKINGVEVYLSGLKYTENGKLKYLMVASTQRGRKTLEVYRTRWQIETMFKAFKSSGFNLEDTHLNDYERINKMLYIIAIAFAWSYSVGIYLHENVKEIKILSHGRKAKSLFKYGLEKLSQCLQNKFYEQLEMLFNQFLSYT